MRVNLVGADGRETEEEISDDHSTFVLGSYADRLAVSKLSVLVWRDSRLSPHERVFILGALRRGLPTFYEATFGWVGHAPRTSKSEIGT